ncbi:MAG: AraC family transcriptional regulator [Nitrosomonas sp.]|nr:MAG: AraC family transcriptional regulator [Nitrosomonas sp.]
MSSEYSSLNSMPSVPKESVTVIGAPSGFESAILCSIWRQIEACEAAVVPGTVPANVYACLNVITDGNVKICEASGESLPHLFLTGPFTAPVKTFASAPLNSLSIVLQPWLLQTWFDLDLRDMANAIIDAAYVPRLSDPAVVDAIRFATFQPSLLESALAMLSVPHLDSDHEASVMANLLLGTQNISETASRHGISVRQLERRFARNFGLSPKEWLRIKRFEGSLVKLADDKESLANVAADAGYADQSHMTRDYRRTTGFTPNQTRDGMNSETPGYWAFKPAKVISN